MATNKLLAGFAGAIALNLIHESLKKTGSAMPRIDLLGEEALSRTLQSLGCRIDNENKLYLVTLAADIASNGLYYSIIGCGEKKHLWRNAFALGIAAGVGAIALPKPLGLDPRTVSRTTKTSVLTVAYYLTGALVTAGVLSAMSAEKLPANALH